MHREPPVQIIIKAVPTDQQIDRQTIRQPGRQVDRHAGRHTVR